MKKLILGIAICLVALGCNNDTSNAEIEKLKAEKDAIIREAASKDSTLNSFMEALNEIEDNLIQVKQKQANVVQSSRSGAELGGSVKDRINEDIQFINELMEDNKNKLSALQSKLKNSNIKIAQLEKTIQRMQEQLEEKDREIVSLKEQLVTMNFQIEQLNQSLNSERSINEEKARTIEQQTKKINTAYFAIGTYKELRDNKVLNKEGGFLGIGRKKSFKSDFNENYFTQIDLTKTRNIPLNVKEAKLATVHPPDSYTFDGDKRNVKALNITNPEKFWAASRYLVIVIEK